MPDSILMVDDESLLLDGIRRQLRGRYAVEYAVGAEAGLRALAGNSFAVIVSDLRMPGMDGIEFLREARNRCPDGVRMMLTGQADVEAAVRAVNQGNLFRFLTKPCPHEDLAAALDAALVQYHLVTSEKELLERTLSGSVKVLTEILSLTHPRAFGRAQRLRRVARRLAEVGRHPAPWQVELAAMLSLLGVVTVPQEILDRRDAGMELRDDEQRILDGVPEVSARLLANIPRLEPCARMIGLTGQASLPTGDDPVAMGARILRSIATYERLLATGSSPQKALAELHRDGCPMSALDALSALDVDPVGRRQTAVLIKDLRPGMVLDEDVRARNGMLLIGRGQELTHAMLERISNFNRLLGVSEPIKVTMN